MVTTPEVDASDNWEHIDAIKKLTAVYVNQLFIQPLGDGNLRLNFGEALDDEPRYHTAIVISAENAKLFSELVYRWAVDTITPPVITPPTIQAVPTEPVNGGE